MFLYEHFPKGIVAATSTREYPNESHNHFLEALKLDPKQFIKAEQVHGKRILFAETPYDTGKYDAFITDKPQLIIGVKTADCLPILFSSSDGRVVGVAHAGWRGLVAGIVPHVIEGFINYEVEAKHLIVQIGPAIQECCYEVSEDFQGKFGRFYQEGYVDLAGFATEQLHKAGVEAANIHNCKVCTACDRDQCFSHRVDATPERMLSIITRV